MPAAFEYLWDVNSKEAGEIENIADAERLERNKQIQKNWDYYDGKHKQALKPTRTGVNDNVRLNKIRLIVDKSNSSMMGLAEKGIIRGPDITVVPGDNPEEDAEDQRLLDLVWKANSKNKLMHSLGITGTIVGHVYVKILPDGANNPDTSMPDLPRAVLLNAMNVDAFTDVADVDRVLWYTIAYTIQIGSRKRRTREDIVRNITTDGQSGSPFDAEGKDSGTWLIRSFTSDTRVNGGKWMQNLSKHPDLLWPFPWSPIVEWQSEPRPYRHDGTDDVSELIDMQDSLNYVASNTRRIIRLHAHPKTVGTGFAAGEVVESSVDSLYTVAAADAKMYNLEVKGDLAKSLDYMMFMQRSMFDSSRELDPQAVQDKLGALTNFGLRVLYRDNTDKLGTRRMMYEPGVILISQLFLMLMGRRRRDIVMEWPAPLPTDPLQAAQTLSIDRQHGASKHSYLEARGYDPDEEKEFTDAERAEQLEADLIRARANALYASRNQNNTDNGGTANEYLAPSRV